MLPLDWVAPVRRRDLEGLRGVAITLVVLYHAGVPLVGSGLVGVDIFFVLSGYLIGRQLNPLPGRPRLAARAFYARRLRRILPALAVVVAATCLAGMALLSARDLWKVGLSGLAAMLGGANVFFWWWMGYFSPAARVTPLLMTWSLGVEMQFYLIAPPLMLALARWPGQVRTRVLTTLALASLLAYLVMSVRYPSAAFFLTPLRLWEPLAGLTLAVAGRGLRAGAGAESGSGSGSKARSGAGSRGRVDLLALGGMLLVLAAATNNRQDTPFSGVPTVLAAVGTLMLIAAPGAWINRRLLAAAPMVATGQLSYSWYLWHFPLMAMAHVVAVDTPGPAVLAAVGLAALGPAWLSWRFVERLWHAPGIYPAREPRTRPVRPPTPVQSDPGQSRVLAPVGGVIGSVVVGGAIVLSALVVASGGWPGRLTAQAQAVEGAIDAWRRNPCLAGYGRDRPRVSADCWPAARAGLAGGPTGRAVVLLGDSHAATIAPAIARIAARDGLAFRQLFKSACPPFVSVTVTAAQRPDHADECYRFNQAAMRRTIADPAVGTVVLAAFWSSRYHASTMRLVSRGLPASVDPGPDMGDDPGRMLRAALDDTIRRYRAAGKRVVLIADVPMFTFDPGKEAMSSVLPVRAWLRARTGGLFNWGLDRGGDRGFDPATGRVSWRWVRPSTPADRIVADAARGRPGVRLFDPVPNLCDARGCTHARTQVEPWYSDYQHLTEAGATAATTGLRL